MAKNIYDVLKMTETNVKIGETFCRTFEKEFVNKALNMKDSILNTVKGNSSFATLLLEKGKKEVAGYTKVDPALVDGVNKQYLIYTGLATLDAVICVEKTGDKQESVIYTRNERLLEQMKKEDLLLISKNSEYVAPTDLAPYIKHLMGKIEDVQTNVIPMVKLVPQEADKDGKLKYLLSKPRKSPNIVDYDFFCLSGLCAIGKNIDSLLNIPNTIYSYTKLGVEGTKEHKITVSDKVMQDIYAKANVTDIKMKLADKKIGSKFGYDVARMRVYGYDAEGSAYIKGMTSFRVERLVKFEAVSIEDVDTSISNVDLTDIQRIFIKEVTEARKDKLKEILILSGVQIDTSVPHKVSELKEMLVVWSTKQDATTLYRIMKRNDKDSSDKGVFNSVDTSLQKREKVRPKVIKEFVPVRLAEDMTDEEKIEYIKERAKTHVLRITATTKAGGNTTIMTTSNPRILAAVLGKNYVVLYETPVIKLKVAKAEIEAGNTASGVLSRYNLVPILCETKSFNSSDVEGTVIAAIDEAVENLNAKSQTKETKQGAFTVRSLNIKNNPKAPFYASLNIKNVIDVQESREGIKN